MMDHSLTLSTEQRLQQRLTPMQLQIVRLLEMSGPEVEDEIRRAVDENPALAIAESDNEMESGDDHYDESAEQMLTADYRDPDDIPSYRLEARNHSADSQSYEPVVVADGDDLIQSLNSQIAQTRLDDKDRAIAAYIIGSLDDSGYLTRDIPEIASDLAIQGYGDITTQQVNDVWRVIRSLEPAGIGAIDLRDALLLQLQRRPDSPATRLALEIVRHYFDVFTKKHFERLAQLTATDERQLSDAISLIRSLNPKPASALESAGADDRARQITPEFNIEPGADGTLTITSLNSIPELQIEESFTPGAENRIEGLNNRQRREAGLFLKSKRDEAQTFIKVVRARQTTLWNVMKAIADIQSDFLLTGDPELLHPMVLKDIAAATGYDISVISRATAAKYVATPHGIYPMKFFFNERPKDGDDMSSHQIAAAIRECVASEDKTRPMSDEAITASLHEAGLDIARRTVAKYREKLGIPPARLRKELSVNHKNRTNP